MAVSGNQLRAARALAGLEQKDLSEASGVSINTIRNMEARGAEPVRVRLETMDRVIDALRTAGVEFIPENGGGAGCEVEEALGVTESLKAEFAGWSVVQYLSLTSAGLGVIGTLLIFFGSHGLETYGRYARNQQDIDDLARRNRRRLCLQRAGLVLLMLSFGCQAAALFVPA